MRMLRLFISAAIVGFTINLWADPYRRQVTLEWEPNPNANAYEIQIIDKLKPNKPISHFVRGSSWQGKLGLGNYVMKIRSLDQRKVPGEWSQVNEFTVTLEKVQIISPKMQEKIKSRSAEKAEVTLTWAQVSGAIHYQLRITKPDGSEVLNETTSDTLYKAELAVATAYHWEVQAASDSEIKSEEATGSDFILLGNKLENPEIKHPENKYAHSVQWRAPENAQAYDYALSKWDPKEKKWKILDRHFGAPEIEAILPAEWHGGKYKIAVRATAENREPSSVSVVSFELADGERTPAAEQQAAVRSSVDHSNGWFGFASYLVTDLDYSGVNSDRSPTGTPLNANVQGALGGTGRIGLGFLAPENNWGFLGIVDDSGMVINSTVVNYYSIEGNAIYRANVSQFAEIRQLMGWYFKHYPDLVPSASSYDNDFVAAMGPHYGIEYWQGLTRKFGLQGNAHLYYDAIQLSTPNGQSLQPSLSYQLGFLVSYRYSEQTTGLVGYAYRTDTANYFSNTGSLNTSAITGNYLNFILEWDL